MKRILIFLVLGAFSGALGCDAAKVEPQAQNPTVADDTVQSAASAGESIDPAPIQKMMKDKLTAMGEHTFSVNCSKCHAFEGNPAPDLVGAGARLDEATFKEVVTKGRGKMPAHSMLTDVQKRALWLFVSSAPPGSAAIAKDREGGGCACGGACGGAGAAAVAGEGCGGSCGQGAGGAPGEGHGCGQGAGTAPGKGCGGSCGQGAGAAPGEGHGCGQGAGAAPGEGCGGGCGQHPNE